MPVEQISSKSSHHSIPYPNSSTLSRQSILVRVLNEVERLVKHVSGSIVITADHANAIGEFGQYGHPGYVPVPALKRVPWVELTGEGTPYNPDELSSEEPEMGDSDEMVRDRLESLGYL